MLRSKIQPIEHLTLLTSTTNASVNAKINEIKSKIPSITNVTTNASLNAKINQGKVETPNISNLATTTALIAVESKIPNVSELVKKKTVYSTKISEIGKNYY